MGTRADFYVEAAGDFVWLGSTAWDGYEPWDADENNPTAFAIMTAKTAQEFIDAVGAFSKTRDDWTDPKQGWPWPWEDSCLTDYAYVWREETEAYCFGSKFINKEETEEEEKGDFPNMSDVQQVTMGARSGIIMVTA